MGVIKEALGNRVSYGAGYLVNATSGYLKLHLKYSSVRWLMVCFWIDAYCQQKLSHAKSGTRIVSVLIVAFSFKGLRGTYLLCWVLCTETSAALMEMPPEETMPLPEETCLWYSLLNLQPRIFLCFLRGLTRKKMLVLFWFIKTFIFTLCVPLSDFSEMQNFCARFAYSQSRDRFSSRCLYLMLFSHLFLLNSVRVFATHDSKDKVRSQNL